MTNFVDQIIWTGDNFDILRGLNFASFDLIYLDPPFNSNRNYAAPVASTAAGTAQRLSSVNWEVDHIIPRDGGKQDNIENLQLLCAR